MVQVVRHSHAYYLFDAEFAHFNAREALLAMASHVLTGNPGLTSRVQAHDQLVAACLLVLCQCTISNLRRTPIPIVHTLQIEEVL